MDDLREPMIETLQPSRWRTFVLYGIAVLLPYNAMISAVDYFIEHFGPGFESLNAICLLVPNFTTLFITAFVCKGDNWRSAIVGYLGLLSACLIMPILRNQEIVLVVLAMLAVFNGLAQAAINGLGSHDAQLLTALQTGQGIAGVVSSVVRIFTKLSSSNLNSSAWCFFWLASAPVAIALGFLRYEPGRKSTLTQQSTSNLILVRTLVLPLFAVFINFVLTLSVFPGLISRVPPRDMACRLTQHWWPVLLFTVFNLFDLGGKYFSNLPLARFRGNRGAATLLLLQVARMTLVYAMVSVPVPDAATCLIIAIFAFTSGWFGSQGFCIQHDLVHPSLQDQASVLTLFFLLFGISTGSIVGRMLFG